jgi:tRNA (cmo5U34)-methyltransferase
MDTRTDEVWKAPQLAATYLTGVRAAMPNAGEQLDVMLRLVVAAAIPVRRILDLGCGDGALAAALLDRFPAAETVLADFSPTMLEAARKRMARWGAVVKFVEADYATSAWMDAVGGGPFDAVVSGLSIHHQTDERKRGVYREIFELLSPGGVFVNIEHVASATPWTAAVNDEWFVDHLCRYHKDKRRGEVAATYYSRADKASNILAPVEAQCGWLRECGYSDVDCFAKLFELAVFGGRKPA